MELRDYKTISTDKIKPFNNNSRTHSKEQIKEVEASILRFGFTNPVLIDEDYTILAGHCRVQAAKNLNFTEIPCIILNGLSETERRAYIIADNKLALNADWDYGILRDEVNYLLDQNFDIDITGFNSDEIAGLFDVDPHLGDGNCDDDEAPVIASDPIVSGGDLFTLGEHRLLCGDSTNATDVEKLLNGQHPNIMITDPPYGVKYEADWRADAKSRKKTDREKASNLQNDDRADWYDAYVLFPGDVAYVWHASAFTDIVMDGLRRANFEVKQQIIWNKNVHALSRGDYHWKHEPCWYAVKPSGNRNWKGGRTQMTIWDVPSIIFDKDKTSHPTQKPVELYLKPINHHTNPGEYVYDPFSGSGTLMVACEKTKRRALMMEFDPRYADVILQRYKKFTGDDPVREDGIKYSDIK